MFMFTVKCILVDNIWYHFSTGHNNTELINDTCVFGVQRLEGILLQQLIIPVKQTFTRFCENLCLFSVYSCAINRLEQSNLYALNSQ